MIIIKGYIHQEIYGAITNTYCHRKEPELSSE